MSKYGIRETVPGYEQLKTADERIEAIHTEAAYLKEEAKDPKYEGRTPDDYFMGQPIYYDREDEYKYIEKFDTKKVLIWLAIASAVISGLSFCAYKGITSMYNYISNTYTNEHTKPENSKLNYENHNNIRQFTNEKLRGKFKGSAEKGYTVIIPQKVKPTSLKNLKV